MNAVERLRTVLCAPDGSVVIDGSDCDRAIIADALTELAALTREAPTEGVLDEMVERACKERAFREDGALWPDAYEAHEIGAERTRMREFLEHVLATQPTPQRHPLSERLYRGAPHPDAHREQMMERASVEELQRHPDALPDGTLSKSTAKRVEALRMAQGDRDAYEGAREDLLDWKGRAQRAEAELRLIGYTGIVPTQPPHQDRGDVTEALRAAYNCICELRPTQARSEVLQMILAAIGGDADD